MSIDRTTTNLFAARGGSIHVLARNWWAVALRGVIAILFGLVTFFWPGITIATLVLFFAAYMVVDGIFGIVSAVRAAQRHERWGWLVLEGFASIAIGVIAFVWPGITVVALVYLIAIWALVTGGLMVGAAFRLNIEHGRWLLVLAGALSIIWGILLLIAPIVGAFVLALWLGAYAFFFGILLLVFAFRLRSLRPA